LTEIANRVILASLLEWCLIWFLVITTFRQYPAEHGHERSSIEFQINTV
jgi:hypothetical protein